MRGNMARGELERSAGFSPGRLGEESGLIRRARGSVEAKEWQDLVHVCTYWVWLLEEDDLGAGAGPELTGETR